MAGVLFSVFAYRISRDADARRIEAEFERRAEHREALTRQIVAYYQLGLYALKSLFEGSDRVSAEEFEEVAQDIITRHAGITALEWVPVVSHEERPAFEAEMSRELGRPFEIRQQAPDGTMVPAGIRAEYLPIAYVKPFAGNERAAGMDVMTAFSRPYLGQARSLRRLTITPRFQLVQGGSGVVMAWPVFARGSSLPPEHSCRGFVQGVFRIDQMLQQGQMEFPSPALDELYLDGSAAGGYARVLHSRWGDPAAAGTTPLSEEEIRRGLYREYRFEIGGREWIALYRPCATWVAEQQSHLPIVWFGVGLGITGLLAALVTSLGRRTVAIQREVDLRTAELAESRRQLASLLHALPGVAYRCTFHEHLDEVLFLSEGALPLTGYTADDFTAKQVFLRNLVHPEDLPRVQQQLKATLQAKQEFEIDYRLYTRTGQVKWVLSRGRGVYAADGQLSFYEGLLVDITAQREAEAEKRKIERKLLESQKLESLGLLAGGIAHDFNNILTGIMGHANLARCTPVTESELAEHLRKIEAGVTRAAELCQQMLAFSGRGRFVTETVDLNRIVHDTLPLLQGSLPTRARLALELPPQPTIVTGDATQLRQIVMNLILNAGEALPPTGGDVTVRSGVRRVDAEFLADARVGNTLPPGEYVFLEVRDTGCGMSAETLDKIFDPFFTTKFTGRGLGLAAVLGIVRGHGGGLRVVSAPGQGATFTLVLPTTGAHLSSPPESGSATPWRRTGRVLVIDDEEPVREIAARLLRTFGFTVVTASDGSDGLRQFRANPAAFDLVFLDLTMPGLDGIETLAGLRALAPGVRVLLASGYSDIERIAHLAEQGPLVFLQKPFSQAALERKLREFIH